MELGDQTLGEQVMGEIHEPTPVLLLLAGFSRHAEALTWARQRAEETWGPVAHASPTFDFVETDYYAISMGCGLKKEFIAFSALVDPEILPEVKLTTNRWEAEYAKLAAGDETRPLNLDPGYLSEAKLVLASTKDHAHRIYLSRGIYAEVTLHYYHRQWRPREWTFPDYRREDYHGFFDICRAYLRRQLSGGGAE